MGPTCPILVSARQHCCGAEGERGNILKMGVVAKRHVMQTLLLLTADRIQVAGMGVHMVCPAKGAQVGPTTGDEACCRLHPRWLAPETWNCVHLDPL